MACICLSSVLRTKSSALRLSLASRSLAGDVLMTVTLSPNALPNLTATWPSPPSPTTPSRRPGSPSSIPCCFMGLYTVIPAHSSGAAASSGRASGMRTRKRLWATSMLE
uniref:Uncharacterized protein n=1 Tax=Triticum urartu TaxID=4572 RepID=A0A8R7TCV7_TRIUA